MNHLVQFPQLCLCFLCVHLCLFVSVLFGLTSFFRIAACSGCQWLLERLNSFASLLSFITCSIFRISWFADMLFLESYSSRSHLFCAWYRVVCRFRILRGVPLCSTITPSGIWIYKNLVKNPYRCGRYFSRLLRFHFALVFLQLWLDLIDLPCTKTQTALLGYSASTERLC